MKAQTYLDIVRGLRQIHDMTGHCIYGSDTQKSAIADDAGAFQLIGEVEDITNTLREVIVHDTGVPATFLQITA